MARNPAPNQPKLKLPVQVASPIEVGRLVQELQSVDEALLQSKLRKQRKAPKTSQLLDLCLETNKLDILKAADRQALERFLDAVRQHAPVLHVSFSADPSVGFTEKLMLWLRREIHPQVLITIGLQPTIGAGCMIRSTNRYFDFTLRNRFANQREVLIQRLQAAPAPKEAA